MTEIDTKLMASALRVLQERVMDTIPVPNNLDECEQALESIVRKDSAARSVVTTLGVRTVSRLMWDAATTGHGTRRENPK